LVNDVVWAPVIVPHGCCCNELTWGVSDKAAIHLSNPACQDIVIGRQGFMGVNCQWRTASVATYSLDVDRGALVFKVDSPIAAVSVYICIDAVFNTEIRCQTEFAKFPQNVVLGRSR